MKALVTGGLGFIGSHLAERLVAEGWEVVIVDDRRTAVVHEIAGTELIAEDLLTADLPAADVIFHLASPVGPLGVIGWRGRLAREVIDSAYRLARHAVETEATLVDVSTSEVYGSGHQDRETDPCVFWPETSARKEYAVGKLAAETLLRNTPGLDVRIVRPFNVAGPRQLAIGGFVLPRWLDQIEQGRPLTVYGSGTQRRAFSHVLDIVDGLLRAYTAGESGEVYNLGNPANEVAIIDFALEVIEATGSRAGFELVDPRRLHGPDFAEAPDKIPDRSKARHDLGWWPQRTRAEIIADAIAARLVAA